MTETRIRNLRLDFVEFGIADTDYPEIVSLKGMQFSLKRGQIQLPLSKQSLKIRQLFRFLREFPLFRSIPLGKLRTHARERAFLTKRGISCFPRSFAKTIRFLTEGTWQKGLGERTLQISCHAHLEASSLLFEMHVQTLNGAKAWRPPWMQANQEPELRKAGKM